MIAGSFKDQPEVPRTLPAIPNRILPVAAIYGANASGKSNVIAALQFMSDAVTDSYTRWKPTAGILYEPFWGTAAPDKSPESSCEIDFVAGETRFTYAFTFNNREILTEWLDAYPDRHRQRWFDRVKGRKIRFGKLGGENRTIENLTRDNSLFLSTAAQNNHDQLKIPHQWLTSLFFVGVERHNIRNYTAHTCKTPEVNEVIKKMLRSADLGVIDTKLHKVQMPAEMFKALDQLMAAVWDSASSKDRYRIQETEDYLQLIHKIGDQEIPFIPLWESKGTLAYLQLLGPIVDALLKGFPLIVDELDASLHPLLCASIVQLFNNPVTNPKNAQLIFNTHDVTLLGQKVLRRDQVWLTEKSRTGETALYPLSDYKLRSSDNLLTGYLTGRYGAIPMTDLSGEIEAE